MALGVEWLPQLNLTGVGVWVGLVGALVWYIRGAPERRRARNEGDGSLRADLLGRIHALEEQQVEDRLEHGKQRAEDRRACDAVTDELRIRIREQDHLIDGLQRQLIMFQIATGRALPPEMRSPEIDKMIEALRPIFDGRERSDTLQAAVETSVAADATVQTVIRDESRQAGEDEE